MRQWNQFTICSSCKQVVLDFFLNLLRWFAFQKFYDARNRTVTVRSTYIFFSSNSNFNCTLSDFGIDIRLYVEFIVIHWIYALNNDGCHFKLTLYNANYTRFIRIVCPVERVWHHSLNVCVMCPYLVVPRILYWRRNLVVRFCFQLPGWL